MTEREAQQLLDEIRTPAAKAAMDPAVRVRLGLPQASARPRVTVGRWRYELTTKGRIWTYKQIGNGQRWALEPGDTSPDAYWLPREVKNMIARHQPEKVT